MDSNKYIDSRENVEEFICELQKQSNINIQYSKAKDDPTSIYTTINTMADLDFDDEDILNEIKKLEIKDYNHSIKDSIFPTKPHFRVFVKEYQNSENILKDVYIKARIEITPEEAIYCISFHYAKFKASNNPYT